MQRIRGASHDSSPQSANNMARPYPQRVRNKLVHGAPKQKDAGSGNLPNIKMDRGTPSEEAGPRSIRASCERAALLLPR